MAKRGRPAGAKDKTPRKKPALKRSNATVSSDMVKAMLPTKKVFDVDWVVSPFLSSLLYKASLNQVAIGGNKNNRIGNKITITNINIRGYFTRQLSNTSQIEYIRLTLYNDKQNPQTSGTTAVGKAEQLFEEASGTSVSANSTIRKFRNYENLDRYQILHDKVYPLNVWTLSTMTQGEARSEFMSVSIKCSIPILFETKNPPSASPAIEEIRSSNIGFLCGWEGADTETVQPTFHYSTRIKYYDN